MNRKLPIVLLVGGLLAISPISLAYGPGPYVPYGYPTYTSPAPVGGVSVRRIHLPDAYLVEIFLHNLNASDVDVDADGFGLRIRSSSQYDLDYTDDGNWFSFYHGFTHFNRRVRLPLNADTRGMERIDGDQVVTIRVPKFWL